MKPVKTRATNGVMRTDGIPNTDDLPVAFIQYADGTAAIESCWQISWREWFRALWTRRIYLIVMGVQHPPVYVASRGAAPPCPRQDAGGTPRTEVGT